MALSIGVSVNVSGSSGTVTTTGVTTQSTGSVLVVGLSYDTSSTFLSLSDSNSNTWTLIQTEQSDVNGKFRMYYAQNATGGTGHTFSFATTGGTAGKSIFMVEIIGGATSNSLDVSGVSSDATSPFDSPGVTTTVADTCLVAFSAPDVPSGNPVNHTAGNSFTKQTEVTNANTSWVGALGTRIVAATGTYNSSWTISGGTPTATFQFIAAFKQAAVAGGFLTRNYWWGNY